MVDGRTGTLDGTDKKVTMPQTRINDEGRITSMTDHRLTFSPRDTSRPFEYDPARVRPIRNGKGGVIWTKPRGGIWLSVDGGWERWCRSEMPHWLSCGSFEVSLSADSRIYAIRSMEDLAALPKRDVPDWQEFGFGSHRCAYIDFERMLDDYDGVFADMSHGDPELRYALYGWDCDSVLLFSADVIEHIDMPTDTDET